MFDSIQSGAKAARYCMQHVIYRVSSLLRTSVRQSVWLSIYN